MHSHNFSISRRLTYVDIVWYVQQLVELGALGPCYVTPFDRPSDTFDDSCISYSKCQYYSRFRAHLKFSLINMQQSRIRIHLTCIECHRVHFIRKMAPAKQVKNMRIQALKNMIKCASMHARHIACNNSDIEVGPNPKKVLKCIFLRQLYLRW